MSLLYKVTFLFNDTICIPKYCFKIQLSVNVWFVCLPTSHTWGCISFSQWPWLERLKKLQWEGVPYPSLLEFKSRVNQHLPGEVPADVAVISQGFCGLQGWMVFDAALLDKLGHHRRASTDSSSGPQNTRSLTAVKNYSLKRGEADRRLIFYLF